MSVALGSRDDNEHENEFSTSEFRITGRDGLRAVRLIIFNFSLEQASDILKESHETEIHVEVLVAVKQGEPRVVGYKIHINPAESLD